VYAKEKESSRQVVALIFCRLLWSERVGDYGSTCIPASVVGSAQDWLFLYITGTSNRAFLRSFKVSLQL